MSTPLDPSCRDAGPEAIAQDVEQALRVADFYTTRLPGGAPWLGNRRVLELGPDPSLGVAVLLACQGAELTLADRDLAAWDPVYHAAFYRALFARLRAERPGFAPDPILRLLQADAFVPETVRLLHRSLGDLRDVQDEHFDLVLSHGVLEQVEHVPRACAELARLTTPGGLGLHQVDFRDQRDLQRPLEHLTLPAEEFQTLFTQLHGACGNRWRPGAMQQEAERAGFELSAFEPDLLAEESYLDDVLPRLHDDYDGLDRDGLRVLSGCFRLRRRVALNTEYPVESDSPQTLAHSRCRYAFAAPYVAGRRVLDVGCGAGLGSQLLIEAGADCVLGLERRAEALALARERAGDGLAWLEHDLEQPLPLPDESFDVVVALEVLEHVRTQSRLVAEIRRVLAPGGVAFVSVPHRPFELFWAELAGESNPFHLHVPDTPEFRRLLAPFAQVELSAQVDMISSLVLPLDEVPGLLARGRIEVAAGTTLTDHGTITVIAMAHRDPPGRSERHLPLAHAWGDYQQALGEAIRHNQNLERYAATLLHERNEALNRLRWLELDGAPEACGNPAARG